MTSKSVDIGRFVIAVGFFLVCGHYWNKLANDHGASDMMVWLSGVAYLAITMYLFARVRFIWKFLDCVDEPWFKPRKHSRGE